MSDLNSCTFSGRLTKDAETKTVGAKQTQVTEFTVANNVWKGNAESVSFIEVQVWGQTGVSLLPYLKKGQCVGVSGEFTQNNWVDSSGAKHSIWRLSTSKVTLLGGGSKKAEEPAPAPEPVF